MGHHSILQSTLCFAILSLVVAEGVAADRSSLLRRLTTASDSTCKVTGPCLPCTATEKGTEAACDESGYRQAVECPPPEVANAGSKNLTDPRNHRRLGENHGGVSHSAMTGGDTESADFAEGNAEANRRRMQMGGDDGVMSNSFQACWPKTRREGLSVLGFETLVALLLTVAAPIMVYRRKKAGSNASSQGMQRIPSNNRF